MTPMRPLRVCSEPGCSALVRKGKCPVHERARQRAADTKTAEAAAFYGSARWKAYRARYLRAHPLCVTCKAKGVITAARVVDHITPVTQGGDVWDSANHQAQCMSCHQRKRGQERQATRGVQK